MTVLELLDSTARYLAKHEVASPRLTIELMLAEALGKTRLQLYLEFDQPVPEPVLEKLRPLVRRRAEGEPLEYLLGAATFAGHRVKVTPAVLIPRPETEILFQAVAGRLDPAGGPVLDIGAGSGALAVALARQFPALEIVGVDLSPEALEVACANGAGIANLRFAQGDLLEAPGLPVPAQAVVGNLPYIPTGLLGTLQREVRREPRLALDGGDDGLDLIRKLIAQSAGRTRYLALELGDGQMAKVRDLCAQAGFAPTQILTDLTHRERILVAEYHG